MYKSKYHTMQATLKQISTALQSKVVEIIQVRTLLKKLFIVYKVSHPSDITDIN